MMPDLVIMASASEKSARFRSHRSRLRLQEHTAGDDFIPPAQGRKRPARTLATVLGPRRMHVNLLGYNPTGLGLRGRTYEPSSDDTAEAFAAILREQKVVAHFRRPPSPDIDPACGQLRHHDTTSTNPV